MSSPDRELKKTVDALLLFFSVEQKELDEVLRSKYPRLYWPSYIMRSNELQDRETSLWIVIAKMD